MTNPLLPKYLMSCKYIWFDLMSFLEWLFRSRRKNNGVDGLKPHSAALRRHDVFTHHGDGLNYRNDFNDLKSHHPSFNATVDGYVEEDVKTEKRQALINRFLPQSKSHIVGALKLPYTLPNHENCDHIIVSRYVDFDSIKIEQTISFFFSEGLDDDGICGYEFCCMLNGRGQIEWLEETRITKEIENGRLVFRETDQEFRPEEIDAERMSQMIDLGDAYLGMLTQVASTSKLPATHRLRRPVRFEPRAERN